MFFQPAQGDDGAERNGDARWPATNDFDESLNPTARPKGTDLKSVRFGTTDPPGCGR